MIYILIILATAVLFYKIGRHNRQANLAKNLQVTAPAIIKYDQEPIELSFEHDWYASDAFNLGLTPEEASWQRRRAMATKASDWMFMAILDQKFDIADTTMYRKNLEDKFTVVTKIRILPVLRP